LRRTGAIAIALLGLAAATACAGGGGNGEATAPPTAKLGGWERVEPGGKTRCARGGLYAFWVRRGDPQKLLVFFEGGGGCFDATTCAPGSVWFDDDVDASDDPAYASGVLSLGDAENPFRDYSMVFIPSCTGDVHAGDRIVTYGPHRVHQRGFVNARAALEHAYGEFPDADEVFVAGCSAGSVGSAFHADSVLERDPDARVTQAGDSLAFVFHRPVNLEGWGAHEHFPDWFEPARANGRWTMAEFLTGLAERYPDSTLARFNHTEDNVQQAFYEAVGGKPGGFAPRLRAAERELKELSNYRSFLACGFDHCSFDNELFFTVEAEGVRLRDWVADLAAGKDVDCPECQG
jgi:Pectinacetylesterase